MIGLGIAVLVVLSMNIWALAMFARQINQQHKEVMAAMATAAEQVKELNANMDSIARGVSVQGVNLAKATAELEELRANPVVPNYLLEGLDSALSRSREINLALTGVLDPTQTDVHIPAPVDGAATPPTLPTPENPDAPTVTEGDFAPVVVTDPTDGAAPEPVEGDPFATDEEKAALAETESATVAEDEAKTAE